MPQFAAYTRLGQGAINSPDAPHASEFTEGTSTPRRLRRTCSPGSAFDNSLAKCRPEVGALMSVMVQLVPSIATRFHRLRWNFMGRYKVNHGTKVTNKSPRHSTTRNGIIARADFSIVVSQMAQVT